MAEVVDFADLARGGRRRAAARRRRRADRLGRPRRPGRGRGRRGARPARDRPRDRPPDDAQDRDAPPARRGGRAAAPFAAVRACARGSGAPPTTVGFPAVLKPADSGGQRGVFLLESLRRPRASPPRGARRVSPTGEAILEEFTDGLELNGIVVARDGEPYPLTLSDRLRPRGRRLRRRLDPRLPGAGSSATQLEEAERVALRAVRALGPAGRDRVPAADRHRRRQGARRRSRCADPGRPDGRPRPATRVGVDLVEIALRHGARRGDARRARRRRAFEQPTRDPLPDRRARARCRRHGAADRQPRPRARAPGRRPGRRRTSRSARRSAPCGSTATGAAT